MTKKEYYEILGINKDASKEEIKKAYKRLAKQYHPDLNKEKGSEEKFKELSEAYAVLNDDNKRNIYDQYGHAGFDQRFTQEDIFRSTNFNDIFSEIFGNHFSDFFSGNSIFDMFSGGSSRKDIGRDLRYDLDIDFMEAVNGTEKEIIIGKLDECSNCDGTGSEDNELEECSNCNGTGQIRKTAKIMFGMFTQVTTCKNCNGQGEVIKNKCKSCNGKGIIRKNKKIKIKIPAGADSGMSLRVSNEGDAGRDGYGDLYIVLHVKESKIFERENNDVIIKIPISFSQAALGDKTKIPVLDGKKEIKIPAGIESGTILRLSGYGIKDVNGYGKGDQLVKVEIKTPKKLSKKEKELFVKLKQLESKKGFFDKIKERVG